MVDIVFTNVYHIIHNSEKYFIFENKKGNYMKKTVLILGGSLFALCSMATDTIPNYSSEATAIDVSSVSAGIPAASSEGVYMLNSSAKGAVASSGTYKYDSNDITLVNTHSPRHLSSTIIDTNDKTGLLFVAQTTLNEKYANGANNYFGFNGTTIKGGGAITVGYSTANKADVWVSSLKIQGITTHTVNNGKDDFSENRTTVNFNLGENVIFTDASTITLTDGVDLNWNTQNRLTNGLLVGYEKPLVDGKPQAEEDGTILRKFADNHKVITFQSTNTTYTNTSNQTKTLPTMNTVKLSKDAMTTVTIDGVEKSVFRNYSLKGSNAKMTFDVNAGNDLIMYNSSSDGLTFIGISLEAGRTLTFQSANTSVSAVKALTVGGDGKYVLDFSGSMSYISLLTGGGNGAIEVTAGNEITASGRTSAQTFSLTLQSGAKVSFGAVRSATSYKTDANGNNTMAALNLADGTSSLTVAGGLRFVGGNINGTVTVNGTGRASDSNGIDDFMFAIRGGKTVFGETAIVKQTYTGANPAKNWVLKNSTVQSKSAANSLSFAKKLYINGGSTFILDSTDAYVLGTNEDWNATSQATSIFHLEDWGDSGMTNTSAITRFEINAENNIGAFSFGAGRTLTLAFNTDKGTDGSLVLGAEEGDSFTSLLGAVANSIVLEGLVDEKLKVYDVSKENLETYFTVADDTKYQLFIDTIDADRNIYWVNTVAVPEPAQWAVVLGAIALAFVAYRRRK